MSSGGTIEPPFFIVGCDRSGTTLLRLMLDRHRRVAVPTESMFITDFLARLSAYGDLREPKNRLNLANDILNHSKVRHWDLTIDPQGLVSQAERELQSAKDQSLAQFAGLVRAVFSEYAEKEGKSRWGDKTPNYVHHVGDIKRLFPNARVIHLVRDGRDVSVSLMGVGFGPTNVYSCAHYWQRAVRAGRNAIEQFPSDGIEIRYEDLARDPASALQRVCEFLNIEYDDAMIRVEDSYGKDKFAPNQQQWFTKVAAGVNESSVDMWKSRLSRRQIAVFEAVAGEELECFEYERAGCDTIQLNAVTRAAFVLGDLVPRTLQWLRLHVIEERGADMGNMITRYARRRPAPKRWKT